MFRNRETTQQLIRRAEEAGYRAIALTVNTPCFGRRERDIRNNFTLPECIDSANFAGEKVTSSYLPEPMPVTWEVVRWLRSVTKLPILLKGVLTSE
jgi:isopentenyl diphosphate isomerase/L-lactate dehydrogenase-like FMN-dependent dehydrogenase